jgi:hypothetical protein
MRLPDRSDAIKQSLRAFLPCEVLYVLQSSPAQPLVAPDWSNTNFVQSSPARGRAVDGLLNLTRKAVVTQFGHNRRSQPRSPALPLFGRAFQ